MKYTILISSVFVIAFGGMVIYGLCPEDIGKTTTRVLVSIGLALVLGLALYALACYVTYRRTAPVKNYVQNPLFAEYRDVEPIEDLQRFLLANPALVDENEIRLLKLRLPSAPTVPPGHKDVEKGEGKKSSGVHVDSIVGVGEQFPPFPIPEPPKMPPYLIGGVPQPAYPLPVIPHHMKVDAVSYTPSNSAMNTRDVATLILKESQDERACKRLIVRCASTVRIEMGCPERTAANRKLATQRVNAWIANNVPDLRKCHATRVVPLAAALALIPSKHEVEAARLINCAEAYDAEHIVTRSHRIPLFGGPLGVWLAYLGFTMNSLVDFQ